MAKESCANCLFLGKDNYMRKDEDVCRRFPPARVDNHNTRYPAIDMDDWCGEWKPNQELQAQSVYIQQLESKVFTNAEDH